MFELYRSTPLPKLLSRQLPAFVVSLVLAELFYKLGSFSLECVAFLATWFVIDFIYAKIADHISKPRNPIQGN